MFYFPGHMFTFILHPCCNLGAFYWNLAYFWHWWHYQVCYVYKPLTKEAELTSYHSHAPKQTPVITGCTTVGCLYWRQSNNILPHFWL